MRLAHASRPLRLRLCLTTYRTWHCPSCRKEFGNIFCVEIFVCLADQPVAHPKQHVIDVAIASPVGALAFRGHLDSHSVLFRSDRSEVDLEAGRHIVPEQAEQAGDGVAAMIGAGGRKVAIDPPFDIVLQQLHRPVIFARAYEIEELHAHAPVGLDVVHAFPPPPRAQGEKRGTSRSPNGPGRASSFIGWPGRSSTISSGGILSPDLRWPNGPWALEWRGGTHGASNEPMRSGRGPQRCRNG